MIQRHITNLQIVEITFLRIIEVCNGNEQNKVRSHTEGIADVTHEYQN